MRLAILLLLTLLAAPAAAFDRSEPANLGEAKGALTRYIESGAYAEALAAAAQAGHKILTDAAAARTGGEKLALVLDIDETSLSNLPVIRHMDFARVSGACEVGADGRIAGLCGMDGWIEAGVDAPLAPVLALYDAAIDNGIGVFFITGRNPAMHDATARNLRAAGYDRGWERLAMEPRRDYDQSAAIFKSSVRAEIEAAGWRIVLNVGDQYSDLLGGHAEHWIKLPNPFYFIE
jgi:acid phosphatase